MLLNMFCCFILLKYIFIFYIHILISVYTTKNFINLSWAKINSINYVEPNLFYS